jgi:peptidoglycan hydrolase-like protein with peptidoglycan-binding domain
MGGPSSFQLTNGTVAPGQTIDVSVNLKAPGSPGTYKGNWKMREPGGVLFGLSTGPFWVQIKAKSAAAVLPDWPIVKSGNSGPEVRALQHLLKEHGFDLTTDGIFGPITMNQVKAFQTANGLTSDGIVGAQTWPQLIVQVQQGTHGQAVRGVQALLSEKYSYGIAVDGDFGPATNNAVRDFQDKNGLAVDGIVGPQTWRMLLGK